MALNEEGYNEDVKYIETIKEELKQKIKEK